MEPIKGISVRITNEQGYSEDYGYTIGFLAKEFVEDMIKMGRFRGAPIREIKVDGKVVYENKNQGETHV